jgi:hypothetical protein
VAIDAITDYIFTDHAVIAIARRDLSVEMIDGVLKNPE